MKLHKFILVLNLVAGVYGIKNADANAQQEFKRICLTGVFTSNRKTFKTHQFAKSCSPTGLCP
jgi:hypothetical protein